MYFWAEYLQLLSFKRQLIRRVMKELKKMKYNKNEKKSKDYFFYATQSVKRSRQRKVLVF